MGEHLRHRLGADYVAIHMTVGAGAFLAHRANSVGSASAGHQNPLAAYPVAEPPPGTFEAMLANAPGPHLLDLRDLPASGPVATWFGWEQHVRDLPAAWRPGFSRWPLATIGWTRLVPAQAFDLVIALPTATPLVPL